MDKIAPITGRCHCGDISYTVEGEVLNMGICHCHDCQKLTGGLAWPFLLVRRESLKISGQPKEYGRKGSSGKTVWASFCPQCGSTLFSRPEVWPEIRTISASTLDDPNLFQPKLLVWTEQAPKCMILDDSIAQFKRNPS